MFMPIQRLLKTSLLGFCSALLLIIAGNMQGMQQNVFPLTQLPQELQREALVIAVNNEINSLPVDTHDSLKIAAQKIRDLASVSGAFNKVINNPQLCLQLIKNLSRFKHVDVLYPFLTVSNAEAAEALGTECAQKRLKLQRDFDNFIADSQQFSMEKFNNFLEQGVDLEWTNENSGATPLVWAVNYNALDAAIALMQQKVYLDGQWGKMSPLTMAIRDGEIKLVQALIQYGANVNHIPRRGDSPLMEVIGLYTEDEIEYRNKAIAMVKMLLAAGANLDTLKKRYRNSAILKEAQEQLKK